MTYVYRGAIFVLVLHVKYSSRSKSWDSATSFKINFMWAIWDIGTYGSVGQNVFESIPVFSPSARSWEHIRIGGLM